MKHKQSTTPRKRSISVKMSVAEQPSTKINKIRGFVQFGNDNLYPQYLINLYENSPTHGAIIGDKVSYIFGKGLSSNNQELSNWLQRANKRESWNDLYFKAALDYEIHNRFYFEVVRTRDNGKRYYHLDAAKIRIGEEEGTYFYSDDWEKRGRKDLDAFIIHDPFSKTPKDEDGLPLREIIPYDEYRPNFDYYGYPNYLSVVTSIATEKEICNYDLNQWKNGFMGATMINFNNGEPETDEEADEIVKNVKNTIGGSGGQNILVNFADNKEVSAEIIGVKGENSAIEADNTAKRVRDTIFTGHKVTSPMLLGVRVAGELGGNKELMEAYELFKEKYVSLRQNRLVSVIEDISGLEGLKVIELLDFTEEVVIEEEGDGFSSGISEEQEKILNACKEVGFSKDGWVEVAGKGCEFNEGKLKFAELSELDLWILKILNENPDYSATQIANEANINKANISASDVFIRLGQLMGLGWILKEGANYLLSRIGEREAKNNPLPEIELETVYSYELRPDAPPLKVGGVSRPFCRDMVSMDKYYKKEDILKLNNDLGTNVWMTRGGWYTKPGTDISLPFCRHWWVQKIISK